MGKDRISISEGTSKNHRVEYIKPISYATFFEYYVKPHLEDLGVTEREYKSYSGGLPYNLSWALLRLHKVTEEEIEAAVKSCHRHREIYKRAMKRNI